MRIEIKAILLFVAAAAGAWLADAAIDVYVFRGGGFGEQLAPSAHEIYMRASFLLSFLILGTVISIYYGRYRLAALKLTHLNTVLSSVHNIERILSSESDMERLVQRICQNLVEDHAYQSAWISIINPLTGGRITTAFGLGRNFDTVAELIENGSLPACMRRTLETEAVQVIEGARHNCPGCPLGPLYRKTGSMLARLDFGGRVYGVIVASIAPILARLPEERSLFSEVASDISGALHGIEAEQGRKRAEAELERSRQRDADLAFRIQQALLFQRPPDDIPGAEVSAITIPSQQVDGDFYDFFRHNDQCFDIIVADVMGKGVTAALVGAATKNYFLRATSELLTSGGMGGQLPRPREIVNYVHRQVTDKFIELEGFVTLFYARIDLVRGLVTYVDCGHTKPIHFRAATGDCELLEGNNIFLGGLSTEIYQQISKKIEAGDVLVFYSDGLVDASNVVEGLYGVERLAELVRSNRQLKATELIDKAIMDVVSFASAESPGDDMTCVVVKIGRIQPAQPMSHTELDISSSAVELSRVRAFVLGLSRGMDAEAIGEHDISRLELAVNEAVSNVMRHAYHGRSDQRIHLETDVYADRIVVRLWHWGDPYDPDMPPPAQCRDAHATGGFGVSIIAQCVDEVQYLPKQGGRSCVVLVKKFKH